VDDRVQSQRERRESLRKSWSRTHLVFYGACGILNGVTFTVETEEEADGRWIAEIPQIPGAMSYGNTRDEAIARVEALGLRVLAERIEKGESSPEIQQVFTVAAA
jgi:predicted RNase H-like HicB family nuclease